MKEQAGVKLAVQALCAVIVGALAMLGGCKPKAEPKTVAYYTANPAERDKVIAECKNNPGKLKDDPDCINANDSAIQGWGKAKLPPVGFAASKPASAASK
jgi:hypothetical protein